MDLNNLAPVAVFAYNRPEHLKKTLEALSENTLAGRTKITVFLDAPKSTDDWKKNAGICRIVSNSSGFFEISLVRRERNLGLAQSIISGIGEILAYCDKVIVIEDDLVTSPYFLQYMNDALSMYGDNPEVASVHGYIYPIGGGLPETFFLRGADCWGWATWKRAWSIFNPNGVELLQQLQKNMLTFEFDLDGVSNNCGMLRDQIEGRNNSWAIRWHASAFLQGMLTLYPGRSMVRNIGIDGSGIHCRRSNVYNVPLSETPVKVERLLLMENLAIRERVKTFFSETVPRQSKCSYQKRSVFERITSFLSHLS